jgi:hypothetical protein
MRNTKHQETRTKSQINSNIKSEAINPKFDDMAGIRCKKDQTVSGRIQKNTKAVSDQP